MKSAAILVACVLALAASTTCACAQPSAAAPAKKTLESHTALTPEKSPPLSPEQLAKRATAGGPAPAPAAPPAFATIKAAPFATSIPLQPGQAAARAPADRQADRLRQLQQRNLATMLGHRPGTAPAVAAKAAPISTALPPDAAAILRGATTHPRQPAHAQAAPATRPGPKPASVETRGPAPTTPTPEQAAKHAQAPEDGRRP